MITVIEEASYDKILVFLAEKFQLDALKVLQNPTILPIIKARISSWTDLPQILESVSGDIFEENINQNSNFLIDYGESKFEPKNIEYLKIADDQNDIYFYSSSNSVILDTTKKLLKSSKIEIINLKKIDEAKQFELATQYRNQISLMLASSDLTTVVKNCATYQEIIDALDFLSLTDSPKEAIKELILQTKTNFYFLSFDKSNLQKDIKKWRGVPEDELQLVLNAVNKYLESHSSFFSNSAMKELILTDEKIKTISKVNPLTFWKLFIYKCLKI